MNRLLFCALTILMFGVKIDAVVPKDPISRPNFTTVMKIVNPSATDTDIQGAYEQLVVSKKCTVWQDILNMDNPKSAAKTKMAMEQVPFQK